VKHTSTGNPIVDAKILSGEPLSAPRVPSAYFPPTERELRIAACREAVIEKAKTLCANWETDCAYFGRLQDELFAAVRALLKAEETK